LKSLKSTLDPWKTWKLEGKGKASKYIIIIHNNNNNKIWDWLKKTIEEIMTQ